MRRRLSYRALGIDRDPADLKGRPEMTRKQLTAAALCLILAASPIGFAGTAFAKGGGGHAKHAAASHSKSHGAHLGRSGGSHGGKSGGGHQLGASGHGAKGLDTARAMLGVVSGAVGR
jgi:hypothetical protein